MGKVVIVDDHPAIRLAVRVLLKQDGHEIVGETDNGVESISLARKHQPDIVVLDIGIPNMDGLSAISRLRLLDPKPKILILTGQPTDLFAARCMKAGANGFLTKNEDLNELQRAVKVLLAGYSFFPEEILVSDDPSTLKSTEEDLLRTLSDRELIILKNLALGKANIEISKELLISNKTVSTYKTRLLHKLNARTLLELIEIAKRNNI